MKTAPAPAQPGTGSGNGPPAAPDTPLPAALPDLASLAALRAWREDLTARAVTHYLDHVRGDNQSSRGILARLCRQLTACARVRPKP
ncbi:hypothetical protein [Paraburkholderia bannensis]|uniref:hypothetical protein n=1 Tax=Paraburkholderia bannensis TaxID=765414 RepID=UPI0012EBC0BB|nr:hypothetical protein [Paraburkholderia bannensis]